MQRMRVNEIEVGQHFGQNLFLASGQKLLGPGIAITVRHLRAIQRSGEACIWLADHVGELVEAGIVAPYDKSSLRLGQRSSRAVLTRGGRVLLEPGQEVEQHHLDALDEVDGEVYQVRGESSPQARRERILLADALLEDLEQQAASLPLRVKAQADMDWFQPAASGPGTGADAWFTPEELSELRNDRVESLRTLFARIEAGVNMPVTVFDPILDDLMDRLTQHPTRFTQLALLCPRREDYLPDHAYTVCVLAMAVAAAMQWPRADVRRLGLAALVADLGMLLVPERIRAGACELTDVDRARVRRHPVFTLAIVQPVAEMPALVQLAAVQHQERENGSGYPVGRRKDAICDYARVLAVADTFAAGTEPRHYRRRKLPYTVMEETLHGASGMTLWAPAVRGLVKAAGLFPVGSYVKLSSGDSAHVIEANPRQIDRPVVQLLDADGEPRGKPINLAQLSKQQLAVVRPLASVMG